MSLVAGGSVGEQWIGQLEGNKACVAAGSGRAGSQRAMLDNETNTLLADNRKVLDKLGELYREVFEHDGFGEIRIEMRILRRGQKEVILHCGRQYRFVVDFLDRDRSSSSASVIETEAS